ncbi:hypothetical protein [Candidatus Mesenet endosymbiont of Phosphuga atrata]|uniref:hypothetical protein n=1 Tax=Candidatus Mesenet endosymbiont of Phosphuga atrata TaxID=3066221 RepID=UPI0030D2C3BE
MKHFFYDASRLAVSFTGIVLDTVVCSVQKLKSGMFTCLNDELVNRDEFSALSEVVKETAVKQSEIEKKLDNLKDQLIKDPK